MAWLSLDGRWLRRGCAWVELRHAVGSEVAVALGMARGLYLTTIECVAVGCRICETVVVVVVSVPTVGSSVTILGGNS